MAARAAADEPPYIDQIIQGLLSRLSKSGDVWPAEDSKLWLRLLEGSFKLIYKDVERANAQITLVVRESIIPQMTRPATEAAYFIVVGPDREQGTPIVGGVSTSFTLKPPHAEPDVAVRNARKPDGIGISAATPETKIGSAPLPSGEPWRNGTPPWPQAVLS
jgi:hypothetical protein